MDSHTKFKKVGVVFKRVYMVHLIIPLNRRNHRKRNKVGANFVNT